MMECIGRIIFILFMISGAVGWIHRIAEKHKSDLAFRENANKVLNQIYDNTQLYNLNKYFPNTCSHIHFKGEWFAGDLSQKDHCYIDQYQRIRIGDGLNYTRDLRQLYFGIYKIKIVDKPIQVYEDIATQTPKFKIPENSIVIAIQDIKILNKFYVIGCMNLYKSKPQIRKLETGYINGWDSMTFERM